MVHKRRKRAAAQVNSQKKKMKKGYVDCWDTLDAVGGLPVPVPGGMGQGMLVQQRGIKFSWRSLFSRVIMIDKRDLVLSNN